MPAKKSTKSSAKPAKSVTKRSPVPRKSAAKPSGDKMTAATLAATTTATPTVAVAETVAKISASVQTPVQHAAIENSSAQPRLDDGAEVNTKVQAHILALRDRDADMAREAASELGRLGDRGSVEALMHAVLNVDGYYHSVVRAAASAALGQIGDKRALQALVAGIHDPMAEASAEAVRALALLKDSSAVEPLVHVLRNPNGFFLHIVRRAAVLALAQLGGKTAKAELQAVAENEQEDFVVRETAQQALAKA